MLCFVALCGSLIIIRMRDEYWNRQLIAETWNEDRWTVLESQKLEQSHRSSRVDRWRSIGIDSANKPKTMEMCCCMSQNIETCARGAGFKGDMFGKTKRGN